jgi:hypothetical protein
MYNYMHALRYAGISLGGGCGQNKVQNNIVERYLKGVLDGGAL